MQHTRGVTGQSETSFSSSGEKTASPVIVALVTKEGWSSGLASILQPPSSANWATASPLLSGTLSSAAVWEGVCAACPHGAALCCFSKGPLRFRPCEYYSLLGKTTFLQHCICRGTVGELLET